ncbi:glycosyltransferase [Actinoplanes sp. NPDC089786]|uniref:glycosyltransferase family 2 protein n=1 Tax=Actinoplanes sp. NPDC089786 TaxID=3155185 RepID=UPI003425EB4E
MTGVSVVIPTVGRPSLRTLLSALSSALSPAASASASTPGVSAAASSPAVPVSGSSPAVSVSGSSSGATVSASSPAVSVEIIVVDDRTDQTRPLDLPADVDVKVLAGPGGGPAAARNIGWRAARHEWVAFLDDDVVPGDGWWEALADDLIAADATTGGVQGNLDVPLPADRRPTDWERVTAGLADGAWLTADMAYRRTALERTGGFDERFPRAFREDAELAHRVREQGWTLHRGRRRVTHPVRPESTWVSLRTQLGNGDDALLRRLYGPRWRELLAIPPGRRHRHALITAAGLGAAVSRLAGFRKTSLLLGAAWATGTAEFAAARILPGPRDPREVATMVATSVAIPPLAIFHWLRGAVRSRTASRPSAIAGRGAAVRGARSRSSEDSR